MAETLLKPFRKKPVEDAAMASRKAGAVTLPDFLRPPALGDGIVLKADGLMKRFGGIKAVQGVDIAMRDKSLHALIGPNGAGKTTAFNLISGMFTPDSGGVTLAGRPIGGLSPEAITRAGIGRSFQITNLFPTLTVEENVRLATQARSPRAFDPWAPASALEQVNRETTAVISTMGSPASRRRRPARSVTAGSACST